VGQIGVLRLYRQAVDKGCVQQLLIDALIDRPEDRDTGNRQQTDDSAQQLR